MRNKKNNISGVQISDKDKKLLYIVGIVAVIFLGYNFFISPKLDTIKTTKAEFKVVKTKRDLLRDQYAKIGALRANNKNLLLNAKDMQRRITPFDSLPYSLSVLSQLADSQKVKIASATCEETHYMAPEQYFSGSSGESSGKIKNGKYLAQNNFTLDLSGSMESVYKFLKNVEENDRKFSIKEFSLQNSKVGDMHSIMKLEAVSYLDTNRPVECPYDITGIEGRFNIFSANPLENKVAKDFAYFTPEYIINIDPSAKEEESKITFMAYGEFDTALYSKSPKKTVGKLTINGSKDNLRATCKLDNNSKVINSKIELKDEIIHMTIMTNKGVSNNFELGLDLSIDNRTPYKLEVKIVNDNGINSRVNIKDAKENVVVERVTADEVLQE